MVYGSKLLIAALSLVVGISIFAYAVIGAVSELHYREQCSHFKELNPTYEIKYDKSLKCAIKINGLWISAYNLRHDLNGQ